MGIFSRVMDGNTLRKLRESLTKRMFQVEMMLKTTNQVITESDIEEYIKDAITKKGEEIEIGAIFAEDRGTEKATEGKVTEGKVNDLLEKVSALVHENWMAWAKDVMEKKDELPERFKKWEKEMIPYEELPDEAKEYDREWGRKFIGLLQPNNVEPDESIKVEETTINGLPYDYIANVTCATSGLGHRTFDVKFTSNFSIDRVGKERDKVINKLAAEVRRQGFFGGYKLNDLRKIEPDETYED